MAFSYQFGANPAIDYPRFLIGDTVDTVAKPCIFQDSEITMATTIQALTWQSSMLYSAGQGQTTLPTPPVSYRRVAATLLDSMAASSARTVGAVKKLLDVELDPGRASVVLREMASCLRAEDDAGAFVVIEQVQADNPDSFRSRWWAQYQRGAWGA